MTDSDTPGHTRNDGPDEGPVGVPRTRDFHGMPAERVDDGYQRIASPAQDFRARLARFVLALFRWKLGGPPPLLKKYVIVAAPHTTWADGVWMLAFAWSWGLNVRWMGKASLARGPLGWIPRRLGIIPVERSAPHKLVANMAEQFARHDELLLSTPPEGTRDRREFWKSGFYQIALAARVPICLSYLDYAAREAGFGPCFMPCGEASADMDRVRAFYKASWGKNPALFTPPLLREEVASSDSRAGKAVAQD